MVERRSRFRATSCRHSGANASPCKSSIAFTLWPPEAVRVTKGAENIGSYRKTERSIRKWCMVCGGHLLTEHPLWRLTDVYAAVIPDVPFKAALHVNYENTVLPMRDGLPKQKDVPADMGGSGQLLPE